MFLKYQGVTLPDFGNPADYLLDICYRDTMASQNISSEISDNNFGGNNNLAFVAEEKYFHRNFDESDFKIVTLDNKDANIAKSAVDAAEETRRNLKSADWYSFIILLLYRNWIILKSSPAPLIIRIGFVLSNLLIPLNYNHPLGSHDGCWSTIFRNDPWKNKSIFDLISPGGDEGDSYVREMGKVTDNILFLQISTSMLLHFHVLITVSMIPTEIKIIQKEISNYWYTINSYIISRLLFSFPIMVIQTTIFVTIAFLSSSQLMEINRLALAILSYVLQAWIAEMAGVAIGSFFPGNVMTSTIVAIMYSLPIIVYGGYFVRVASASFFVSWLMWISQIRHGFEAIIIIVYGFGRCDSERGTAFTADDMNSPAKMMERFFVDYDITFKDSPFISPVLGLRDEFCLAEVINGTRDYLGVNYSDNGAEENDLIADESSFSYPMSSFGLHDSDLHRSFSCLAAITACTFIVAVISVRRLIKN